MRHPLWVSALPSGRKYAAANPDTQNRDADLAAFGSLQCTIAKWEAHLTKLTKPTEKTTNFRNTATFPNTVCVWHGDQIAQSIIYGDLGIHCRNCRCSAYFEKCTVIAKSRNQLTREIIEAEMIARLEDNCVSSPPLTLSKKGRIFSAMTAVASENDFAFYLFSITSDLVIKLVSWRVSRIRIERSCKSGLVFVSACLTFSPRLLRCNL